MLWLRARDLAVQAADLTTALRTVDHAASRFEVDELGLKIETLTTMTQENLPDAQLLEVCGSLRREALRQERFDDARRVVEIAAARARVLKTSAMLQRTAAQVAEIDEARAGLAAVAPAITTLAKSPDDPDANLAVGRYRCLLQGDWEAGLPLLRNSSGDDALRTAAEQDLNVAEIQPLL